MRRLLTVTITTPGVPVFPAAFDGLGEPILGAPVVTSALVKGFAPRESSETAEDFGGRSISGGTVYGYRGTVVSADAIITIEGVDYLIDGELGDWNPAYSSGVELGAEGVEFAVKRAS